MTKIPNSKFRQIQSKAIQHKFYFTNFHGRIFLNELLMKKKLLYTNSLHNSEHKELQLIYSHRLNRKTADRETYGLN